MCIYALHFFIPTNAQDSPQLRKGKKNKFPIPFSSYEIKYAFVTSKCGQRLIAKQENYW